MSVDNFERVSNGEKRRLESRSSVFQPSSERGRLLIRTRSFKCVWRLVQTRLASRLNTFGISFEHVWLLVRTRLAFRSNTFGFSFEPVSYSDRTGPGCGANAFIHGANALGQKTRYLVLDGYCIWCSSIDRLDNFELFIDRQHYFSSFKLRRHSSHFAKILFNRQHDLLRMRNQTKAVFR